MAYSLLFSRNRSNDDAVRFTDVPITDSSIMIDALSILSQFRRSAGWLYPIVPATDTDFERGRGQLVLFGKNRIIFPDYPAPYYLEFFPRFGVKQYILSIYTGTPGVSGEVGWVNIQGGGWWVNFFPSENLIRSRFGGDGQPVYDFMGDVVEAVVFGGGLFFKRLDQSYEKWLPYTAGSGPISIQEYELIRSYSETIVLT